MTRTRLQIAKPDILALFDRGPAVLREREIAAILSRERVGWRLAQSTTVEAFIAFLLTTGKLTRHRLDFPNRPETLFVWGSASTLEVLLHLKPRSYYSHYTAMRFHGLTEQVPKTLYVSHERLAARVSTSFTQQGLDEAFSRPARVSNNKAAFRNQAVVLLNTAFTEELGVVAQDVQPGTGETAKVRCSNVERTLIDAVVRPVYCGGVFEVAKAFELAKDDLVSVNALSAMLKQLAFAYPYHQALGFYLERAGYRARSLDLLRRFPMEYDFYLTHEMDETRYVKDWRLYIPKGF